MTQSELFGVLRHSEESCIISRGSSERMQLAILRYFVRSKAWEVYPQYWLVAKRRLEIVLLRHWCLQRITYPLNPSISQPSTAQPLDSLWFHVNPSVCISKL